MARFKRSEDVKVGVVGYGGAYGMGRHHLDGMRAAGMTPVAVAEVDPARLAVARADFPGIGTYASATEMLEKSDVNLVTIITPHNTHSALAIECLRAGRHVVCEKPMAITTDECDAMIAEAAKGNLVLSAYHNRHWDGCIMNAVEKIRSGAIGEVVRIEAHMGRWGKPGETWRSSRSISGGILYDWGAHLLEYSLQIIDDDIVEVCGFARTGFWAGRSAWKDDTNEDEAFAVVRFAGGAWLTLSMSSIDSNPKRGMLEITGTKGSFVFGGGPWELTTSDGDGTVVRKGDDPPGEGWRYYKNVADHLTKDEALIITADWARRPIHILDLAGRSARQGAALKAKYV